jgi:hypothetical protein
MDLIADDRDREKEADEPRGKVATSRTRKAPRSDRKSRVTAKKPSARRRRKRTAVAIPSRTPSASIPRTEHRPLIPQPTIDLEEDDAASDEGEQRQEPPPPSASVDLSTPKGDDDDLFEYVI